MKSASNVGGQQGSTLEQMQSYINQLTAYIAQNNQKYQKNMHTLKQFYQEQLDLIQHQKEDLLNDNSAQQNEIITLRDLLAASQLKLKQAQEVRIRVERREEESRGRLEAERQRNQQMHQKMGEFRVETEKESQRYRGEISQMEDQNRRLSGQLSQKQEQLRATTQKVNSLQNRLDEHCLLPGKIEDMQRQGLQSNVKMQQLIRSHNSMRDQFSAKQALIVRLQNENEALRIAKGTFQSDKKRQIEEALSRDKQQFQARIDKLEKQNQSLVYQMNEAESRVLKTAKELAAQEEQIAKQRKELGEIEGLLAATNHEKQEYLAEFGSLKTEYEGVIQRLEDALLGYQKKNWEMEQENKDLNSQLESLKQLLTELKAINNLQANRQEYRKLAEMQVIARRAKEPKAEFRNDEKREEERRDNDSAWEKLMADIDNIAA